MRHVYLAGPIDGCNQAEAKGWREYVRDMLAPNVVGVSPLRCEPITGERYELNYADPRFGTPPAISGKNWFDVTECDVTLAYLPRRLNERRISVGTIVEIGWATACQKHVIVVTDDPRIGSHPLIHRNAQVLDNLEAAAAVVNGWLGVYG